MRILLFYLVTLVGNAACAGVKKMPEALPICRSMADCDLHDRQRVQVLAVYQVWDPLPDRAQNQAPAQQVMLVFANGEEGPFLEAWGYEGHQRPVSEISRYRGQQVRVTGTFLRQMPPHPTDPPEAASLSGPCLHPVEKIELVPR
jgi:hypothetical protein